MANNIKGITVEIGGNAGPLNTALKSVNKTAGDLQSELREVNRQLKFDPSNTTLLAQKQDLLKQSSEALKEKQAALKEAVTQAQAQLAKGDLGAEKVRAVEREYEKVTSQIKDLEGQIDNSSPFSNFANKLNLNSESIKTSIGAIGVAAAGVLKSAVDSATGAEEKTETVSVLLENQGLTAEEASQKVDQFTKSITDMSSFSAGEAKDALQALVNKGMSWSDALQNSTMLANVAAGSHQSLASAADMLAGAYNGKAKALTALGILSKDEAKQLGDSENATISMATVQERLNERYGGSAQAQLSTYSGKLKENTNQINSARTAIGTALLPILASIADMASKVLIPVTNFIKDNPKLTAAIMAVIAVIGTLVGGMSLANTVMGFFGTVMGGLTAPVSAAGIAAGGAATGFSAMLLPVTLVVAAVAALVAGAILVVKNWGPISNFFKGLWEGIKSTFSGVGEWFKSKFDSAKVGVQSTWNGIGDWFSKLWNTIATSATKGFNDIKSGINTAMNAIKAGLSAAWNGIKTVLMAVVTPIATGIINIWNFVKGGITTAMNGIKNVLQGAWEIIKNIVLAPVLFICDLITGNFGKLGSDMSGIWNNIKAGAEQVWNGLKEFFSGILQSIVGFFTLEWNGIVNISTTVWNGLASFFTGLWTGITNGITAAWNAIPVFFSNLWNGISTDISTAWDEITSFFSTTWSDIKAGISAAWNAIPAFFENIWNTINNTITNAWNGIVNFLRNPAAISDAIQNAFNSAIDWIKNLGTEALQWGKDIINGIVNGIKSAAGAVGDAVTGVAQDIRKFLHFSVPDEGPLADFDTWMPDMMNLMAQGITDNVGVVISSVVLTAAKMANTSKKEANTVGLNIGSGLSNGIDKSKASVLKTAKDMSDLLTDQETKLQNQISDIQKQTASQTKKSDAEILQDNLNTQLKLVQDFKKQYDDAIAAVEKEQKDMSDKLLAFGDLFTRTKSDLGDSLQVNDLQTQIDAINGYGDALDKLKKRGVSDSLLDKVKDMSIEDATQYTQSLLSMSDDQYKKYMQLWDEKQTAAKSVAERFYKGELDSLKASFVDKIPSELSGIKDQMKDIGVMSGTGLAQGFASQSAMITATFVGVLQAAYAAAKESMDIHSPSRKWAFIGEQNAAGLGVGFVEKMKSVTKQMTDSIPTKVAISGESTTTARISEGLVNGLAAVMGTQQGQNSGGGSYTINVMIPNGDVLASVVFDPLRNMAHQKGVSMS